MRDQWQIDGVDLQRFAWSLAQVDDSPPGRRGADLQVAGKSGVKWRRKPFDARTVAFTVNVRDVDDFGRRGLAAVRYNMDRLKQLWYGDGQVTVTRTLVLPGGELSVREAHVEVIDTVDVQSEQPGNLVRLGVTAFMADPFWYGRPRKVAGKSGQFVVFNPGTVRRENVTVRIFDASNPTISNVTAETEATVTGTFAGWVEIDADRVTAVTDTDANVTGDLSRTSRWPVEVMPGRNVFNLSDGTCDVTWRPAWL